MAKDLSDTMNRIILGVTQALDQYHGDLSRMTLVSQLKTDLIIFLTRMISNSKISRADLKNFVTNFIKKLEVTESKLNDKRWGNEKGDLSDIIDRCKQIIQNEPLATGKPKTGP